MSKKSLPPSPPLYRPTSAEGLCPVDPDEFGGLQHISSDRDVHKQARPQSYEGLQYGIPTKHLAGLQVFTEDDGLEHIHDKSNFQPEVYQAGQGEKGMPLEAGTQPIRVLGMRRRIFYMVLTVALIVIIAATVGTAVGVTTAQRQKLDADTVATSTTSPTATRSTPTSASSFTSMNAPLTTSMAPASTIDSRGVIPTWSITMQTVAEFLGSVSVGATPSFFTTAEVTVAGYSNSPSATAEASFNDCPQTNNTIVNTTPLIQFQKFCYMNIIGASPIHKTRVRNLDDCIMTCSYQNQDGNVAGNPSACFAVSYNSNFTGTLNGNCYLFGSTGRMGPGDYMTASAILINTGVTSG